MREDADLAFTKFGAKDAASPRENALKTIAPKTLQ